MPVRSVAQWTEILAALKVEHGARLTPRHIAERILGDFLGYEHPVGGTVAIRSRRQTRKAHDIAELGNAILASVALLSGVRFAQAAETGATVGRAIDGKPSWYGHYKIGDAWHFVTNTNGDRVCYTSPEAAEAGAKVKVAEAAHSHALDVALPGRR